MIKAAITAGVLLTGIAFAAGYFVGWKTTLKVLESVNNASNKDDDE